MTIFNNVGNSNNYITPSVLSAALSNYETLSGLASSFASATESISGLLTTGDTRVGNGSAGAPSISFTNNTNSGLFYDNTAVGSLSISSNSVGRMRFLNNGNVGIGTSSPGSLLDVNGNINAVSLSATTINNTTLNSSTVNAGTVIANGVDCHTGSISANSLVVSGTNIYGANSAQLTYSSTQGTSSTSFTNVIGLSIAITPQSSSKRILISLHTSMACSGSSFNLDITRNGVSLSSGNGLMYIDDTSNKKIPVSLTFLDSPATTSVCVYQLQFRANNTLDPVSFNQNTQVCCFIAVEI